MCGRHTGLRGERASNRQLHCENGVRVTMAHAIATAVEGAHIVRLCSHCARECWLRGLDLLLWLHLLLTGLLWRHARMLQRTLGWRRCAIWAQGTLFSKELL